MTHVFEYHLVNYRRTWRSSALSTLLLPLLTMVGFGLGVGGYVQGGIAGVPYLDWMVPGLIASTAMQAAIGESTWPVLSYFEWLKVYFAQAAAPLRVADILGGHLAFMMFRVLLSVTAFVLIAALFGTLHSVWALAVLPISVLTGLAVAAPVTAYSASVSSDSYLAILVRFAVLPMSLFSGVFFPLDSLHPVLRAVAWALPLSHGVDLSRTATLGLGVGWADLGQVLYLLLWCAVGWFLALRRFGRRLVV
ncbi:putative ABC transporter permease protein [Actinoplanes missouriensis 431]|uniref:Transport permease protein n=1 Tax=Actinoplanes missouriensis (strain ATCC 14538 / DSM 43046 / CBS 188.64 / JCM 3121 / NBRC 102363 / NCIMB 12654 / NRRL B-3342 / UNCC 431) TaxID=512565 RepID=I0H0B0_ACTM4|nr:ABC transporter permease [Actinoplanes missouriensis]BAL86447.1 putative ABC transporter permease protein [Actinoplanes missouriensis 431]